MILCLLNKVYGGKGFLPQSDVYSIAIMIWEFVVRILTGQYQKPYSEYKHIRMEVQILVQAAKLKLRPTIKVYFLIFPSVRF